MNVSLFLPLFPLLLAAPPGESAEDLFHRMEAKLAAAKTLQVAFKGTRRAMTWQGSLTLARGDKARLEMKGEVPRIQSSFQLTAVSDGFRTRVVGTTPKGIDRVAPKGLNGYLLFYLRWGMMPDAADVFLEMDPDEKETTAAEIGAACPASGFKFGKKEKVGGRLTQVIEYTLTVHGEAVAAAVWLDTQTSLPLKHVLRTEREDFAATYTDWRLDEEIDAKKFEVRK